MIPEIKHYLDSVIKCAQVLSSQVNKIISYLMSVSALHL